MSANGVVVPEAPSVSQPQVKIDTSRILEIIREENPMVFDLAVRRATIEAQAKLIEELTTRLGDTVP
jgi:hypothetical protein